MPSPISLSLFEPEVKLVENRAFSQSLYAVVSAICTLVAPILGVTGVAVLYLGVKSALTIYLLSPIALVQLSIGLLLLSTALPKMVEIALASYKKSKMAATEGPKIHQAEEVLELDTKDDPILPQLICPISLQAFESPVITPYGITYSREHLVDWLKIDPSDPSARRPLQEHMLVPNCLVEKIALCYQQDKMKYTSLKKWKQDPILQLFEDPISHQLMEDPVITPDGTTFDRKVVEKFLGQNQNKLPNGTNCSPEELIANRKAKDVLDGRKEKLQNLT